MPEPENNTAFPADIPPGEEYYFIYEFVYGGFAETGDEISAVLNARADLLEDAYADHPRVLAELMEFRLDCLIDIESEVPALYGAIARWPDITAIRLMLVRRLVRLKRYPEAVLVLHPLVEKKQIDAIDPLYDLALTYHRAGNHREALKLLDACRTISPDIDGNQSFAKLRRIAVQLQGTRVPFDAVKRFRHDRALRAILYTFAGIGVLLVLLSIGLAIASIYLGRHAEVYVVNGLDRDYTATLNGASYVMPARGVRKLILAEGDIAVATPDLPINLPTIAAMHRSFFSRPFRPAIFVINPDGGAILEETAPRDAQYGFAGAEKHRRFIAGKPLLRFGQIDLPFEPPPFKDAVERELRLQTRLSLLQGRYDFSAERYLPAVSGELPRADVIAILQAQTRLSAHSKDWQAALACTTAPSTPP